MRMNTSYSSLFIKPENGFMVVAFLGLNHTYKKTKFYMAILGPWSRFVALSLVPKSFSLVHILVYFTVHETVFFFLLIRLFD